MAGLTEIFEDTANHDVSSIQVGRQGKSYPICIIKGIKTSKNPTTTSKTG